MDGKTVVITGAGSGVGLETADALARQGAVIGIVDIVPERGAAAIERVSQNGPTPHFIPGDLSNNAGLRALADDILAWAPRIDVLVNSAGAWFRERHLNADGLELTFALNHMGYFGLTNLLLDRLIQSAPARIVSVASEGHAEAQLDFDDLQMEKAYTAEGRDAYCRSKLANVLFTVELARRLEGTGVTATCCHPGRLATHFYDTLGFLPPGSDAGRVGQEAAAHTVAWLASSPEVEGVSGEYFDDRVAQNLAPHGRDEETALRLWEISSRFAGIETIARPH
jgi:NAD(P)-dependent dehydrogenase (short-subunit alcohol dehydrogenase family)